MTFKRVTSAARKRLGSVHQLIATVRGCSTSGAVASKWGFRASWGSGWRVSAPVWLPWRAPRVSRGVEGGEFPPVRGPLRSLCPPTPPSEDAGVQASGQAREFTVLVHLGVLPGEFRCVPRAAGLAGEQHVKRTPVIDVVLPVMRMRLRLWFRVAASEMSLEYRPGPRMRANSLGALVGTMACRSATRWLNGAAGPGYCRASRWLGPTKRRILEPERAMRTLSD